MMVRGIPVVSHPRPILTAHVFPLWPQAGQEHRGREAPVRRQKQASKPIPTEPQRSLARRGQGLGISPDVGLGLLALVVDGWDGQWAGRRWR